MLDDSACGCVMFHGCLAPAGAPSGHAERRTQATHGAAAAAAAGGGGSLEPTILQRIARLTPYELSVHEAILHGQDVPPTPDTAPHRDLTR